jgi:two-component system phosphate regulon sensor histidine kinase PhoR
VEKEQRSLNGLVEEACQVLAPMAAMKQIQLVCEPSNLYLGVFADRDMLLQAILNLGSNAVKYTPVGGKVTLTTRQDERASLVEVRDSGVGLSEEDRLRVFEKFYRVAKDKAMASGTGLGLPLVKHIVEDVHGGRVEVESQLGVGSCFRIVLPAVEQQTRARTSTAGTRPVRMEAAP